MALFPPMAVMALAREEEAVRAVLSRSPLARWPAQVRLQPTAAAEPAPLAAAEPVVASPFIPLRTYSLEQFPPMAAAVRIGAEPAQFTSRPPDNPPNSFRSE